MFELCHALVSFLSSFLYFGSTLIVASKEGEDHNTSSLARRRGQSMPPLTFNIFIKHHALNDCLSSLDLF